MVVRESMKTLDAKRGVWNDAMPAAFACFDLNPDGTVRRTPLLGTRFAPLHLFPRLPVNEKEAAGGWQAHDERDDATTQYEAARTKAKADGPTIDFVADQSAYQEKIYEGKDRRTFHFDRSKGLVVRAEIEQQFGSHLNSKGAGTLELKSIEEMEPGKLATFRDDMNRAFLAHQAYRKIYRSVPTSGDEAEALLTKARACWIRLEPRSRFPRPLL